MTHFPGADGSAHPQPGQQYPAPAQQFPQGSAPAYAAPGYSGAIPHASVPAATGPFGPGGAPVASGYQMKERGPVMVWLVFPIITLGIYTFVWYYKIHKEMADFDRRRQVPVAGPMLVLLFLTWTVVAPLISFYNTGQRIQNAQRAAGLAPTCSPIVACLLAFVFGLNTLYMQSELNKVVNRYAGAPEGSVIPLFV